MHGLFVCILFQDATFLESEQEMEENKEIIFFYIWAFLVTKKQINLGILFQLNKCGGEIIFYGILRENTK